MEPLQNISDAWYYSIYLVFTLYKTRWLYKVYKFSKVLNYSACVHYDTYGFSLSYNIVFKIWWRIFRIRNFLKKKIYIMKINRIPLRVTLSKPRGIQKEERDSILQSLPQVIPDNRKSFWENISTC